MSISGVDFAAEHWLEWDCGDLEYLLRVTEIVGSGTVSAIESWHDAGTTASLTATPDSGWKFLCWTGEIGDFDIEARNFCHIYYKHSRESVFEDIHFRRIRGKVAGPSVFDDTAERPFRNLTFEDVALKGETDPRVGRGQ